MAYLKCFDKDENEITQAEADALTASGKHHRASGGNCYFFTDAEEVKETSKIEAWEAGTESRAWRKVRETRDSFLNQTDWSQSNDIPDDLKSKYTTYRQSLRDLPQDYPESGVDLLASYNNKIHHSNPVDDGKWPTKPKE